jgi:arginase family enzyme
MMVRLTLLLAVLFLGMQCVHAEWAIPDELQESVNALTAEQARFIESGAILNVIPEQQLRHELATRDAHGLRALVSDLMSVAQQMGYDPARDMGAAPLNLSDYRFNDPSLPTPKPLRKLERDDGPFSVHRYLYPKSGVPTFGGAKVAIWPEDLVAGNVDVAIMGVPHNMSSGRRDASAGPDAMRGLNTIAMPDVQSLLQPLEVLSVVDYGNIHTDWLSTERSIGHVANMVAERGAGSFGLLHFSAHPDVENRGDHTISDRQALFRLLEHDIVNGSDTVQVGLRGPDVSVETLQRLRDSNVSYHTMAEIQQRGYAEVMKRVLREVDKGPDAFFVSIDVSVIDPAELIAAGRVSANGLSVEEVTRAIRHVCAAKDIVGFEITDLAPMLDYSELSVTNANALLNACLVGVAVRKAKLDADYVHPLALDHGQ